MSRVGSKIRIINPCFWTIWCFDVVLFVDFFIYLFVDDVTAPLNLVYLYEVWEKYGAKDNNRNERSHYSKFINISCVTCYKYTKADAKERKLLKLVETALLLANGVVVFGFFFNKNCLQSIMYFRTRVRHVAEIFIYEIFLYLLIAMDWRVLIDRDWVEAHIT